MATADVAALDRIIGQCERFRQPDPKPLLRTWRKIIEEDNRRGVMAGQDCFGKDMPAVTYRSKDGKGRAWSRTDALLHKKTAPKRFQAPLIAGHEDNLTTKQYQQLTGPPLAPRGLQSRVIRNLQTGDGFDASRGVYYAVGAWANVVSRKGVPFLLAHFTGANTGRFTLKTRDLRGIRPWGQYECLNALEAWGVAHVKATFI